jgi:hypothetical protein
MRRRELIVLAGGLVAFVAHGQVSIPRVALFTGGGEADAEFRVAVATFVDQMRQLGWIDGQTLRFDYRWAEAKPKG